MRWSCLVLPIAAFCAHAADDRLDALRAIFPGMDVVATSRHQDHISKDQWMEFPDALAAEPIFQVNGPPSNELERCASEDMQTQRFSHSRELRMLLLPWPRTRADFLAVLQYDFIGAKPAGSCWSAGILVHLFHRGSQWEIIERQVVEPFHHRGFSGIRLVDLTGDGVDDLVVEPDFGGAGTTGTSLLVYDLSGRRFRQIFKTQSRLEYETSDFYFQQLDPVRSAETAGKSVCFELTVLVKSGTTYRRPRISQQCYPTITGADPKEQRALTDWLRPI